MKIPEKVPYLILGVLGSIVATSAYLVYQNTLKSFPVGAAYFWFTLFGSLGSLFISKAYEILSGAHSKSTGNSLKQSMKKLGIKNIAIDSALHALYFAALLYAVRSPQPSVVLAFLVFGQLKMPISAILGWKCLGDTFRSWPAYVFGSIATIAGIFLFKYQKDSNLLLDLFTVLAIASILIDVVRGIFDAHTRRKNNIPQDDMVIALMIGTTIIGFIWMVVEVGFTSFQLPTWEQFGALAYLGIVPTAGSLFLTNTARDKLSIQVTDAISNLRPVFLLAYFLIPFSWFVQKKLDLEWYQIVGIILSILGVFIVMFFAKGKAHSET